MGQLRRKDLIYPELSYQIVGVLFEVWNKLGPGHHENYYQKAVRIGLKNCNLNFREQVYIPLNFKGERVGSYYLDFVIENKIVLEIKKGDRFSRTHIEQSLFYL
ncbi:GxxExxY protein, partial [bacterium]|nr:GxxExxY protein [bacterium]